MAWIQSPQLPDPIPPRPALVSQQSSSLPTSPYQQPRDLPSRPRSPSLGREILNSSPRSTKSDTAQPAPPTRSLQGGCKYEVAPSYLKRRIPYSEGSDPLESPSEPVKERLSPEEDRKLTKDMELLYEHLLPTRESEGRRTKLVHKLETILNTRWPGYQVTVNVFGSTGNKLGTSESDVDICVTTNCKPIENICNLADLCAKKGMERVVCIAGAKVPIVKIWDPELQLACDINVNQYIAMENTAMIRTYVDLDDRVRPLAMVIKHWTRKRILNDAGRNFTVSSYTWICMILNFLQTRKPPILPSLQQQPGVEPRLINNVDVSFARDVDSVKDYGLGNSESIGQLFFQFFRYYGYELDYETSVISVREGKVVDKSLRWQRQQNNRLCVEEPFNTSWNLGKTADDTSFRGVHLELRRAFDFVSKTDLEGCCEQYVFPKEEPRSAAIPIQRPSQPVTVQPSRSSRGNRGGRNGNTNPKASQSQGRRASSGSNRQQPFSRQPQWTFTPQEYSSLQAEQQRYMLHDHLYQQYQLLQAQEQELRMQLQQQAMQNGGAYPTFLWPTFRFSHDDMSRARAGTVNHPPMSAPIRQGQFSYPPQYMSTNMANTQGSNTSPPSPLLTSAFPDGRRSSRRSSVNTGSATSMLRAQSQPAQRPMRSPIPQHVSHLENVSSSPSGDSSSPVGSDNKHGYFPVGPPGSSPGHGYVRRNSALLGYYLGHTPDHHAQPMPIPGPLQDRQALNARTGDPFVVPNGPLSVENDPDASQTSLLQDKVPNGTTISPSPSPPRAAGQNTLPMNQGPLVIDGSKPVNRQKYFSEDRSDNESFDTVDDHSPDPRADSSVQKSDTSGLPPIQGIRFGSSEVGVTQHDALGIMHAHPVPERRAELSHENRLPSAQQPSLIVPQKFGPPGADAANNRNLDVSKQPDAASMSRAQALSPVKEVRTPSPTLSRDITSNSTAKSTPAGRNKTKHKHEKIPTVHVNSGKVPSSTLASKPNGQLVNETSKHVPNGQQQPNSWQTATAKKKHKKGAKSTNDAALINANGGEFLPADEKMRKGG